MLNAKFTNEDPFSFLPRCFTKWIWNSPIKFINRRHAAHIASHIKCHSNPRSLALRKTAVVHAPLIAQAADAYLHFAQRFTHLQINCCVKERKEYYSQYIFPKSALHQLWFVFEHLRPLVWSQVCALVKYSHVCLNAELRMRFNHSREVAKSGSSLLHIVSVGRLKEYFHDHACL